MRYQNIKETLYKKKRIYNQIYTPNIEEKEDDTYIISGDYDRLDLIAYDFYGDSQLWWVLPIINSELNGDSLHVPSGIQIRIPKNIENILNSYNNINNYE